MVGPGASRAGAKVEVRDQGPRARRRTQHSSGLGLAFAKLAVEAHGDRIWVESEVGSGSTFWFLLPCS